MGWVCLGRGWWRVGLWLCASWGAPRDRSCTRRDRSGGGAFALTRWGEWLLRSNARSGSVALLLGCSGDGGVCLGTGCLRVGNRGGVRLGVAPRDRSCTRRDRSGGGAIALTRWGEVLLRSYARSGPVPLLHWRMGVGGVCLGTGCWGLGIGVVCHLGWLRGTGPALAGIAREEGLSR